MVSHKYYKLRQYIHCTPVYELIRHSITYVLKNRIRQVTMWRTFRSVAGDRRWILSNWSTSPFYYYIILKTQKHYNWE